MKGQNSKVHVNHVECKNGKKNRSNQTERSQWRMSHKKTSEINIYRVSTIGGQLANQESILGVNQLAGTFIFLKGKTVRKKP